MELFFLVVLILLMVGALSSGFPVAFALPGSAILSIGLAALCGYLVEGDASAYFAQDGPVQWLSAGVTNFRSLYWDVERDTLIAIPLFVFMGIMLQRSKIAEDLLVTMAQLFGPVPGGLGISVVFVGALLAATTGIVGATVIAMGLISLPAMLRNRYSRPLATGTICAAGTLGQIIPPSIVLIILADQLSSAADQASAARKAQYRESTGEFAMPSELDVSSASAGDMFMGAFLPGLVLVGLYMAYILISALFRPGVAPSVPREGAFDRRFALRVFLSLIPPLALIFVVLGSIVLGVATVNQAGAIGAIGAMVMAGYRLRAGRRGAYVPAILAVASTAAIIATLAFFEPNVKNVRGARDALGIALASVAVGGLLVAVAWSAWRAWRSDDALRGVMIDTARITSMVFVILIGAAMLTSAFRAFGGEELVRHFLTGLPGGFWSQFVVVMAVIFLLGFFLDFIEIAVVVVPIVAPILLADPGANVTAVWLGVMIGLNIQTSFLTPPFGFALFYLRGVAPPSVRTLQIYRGAVAFIVLQLAGLAIVGFFPALVNYLPNRTYLGSETAPPPMNPRLQHCLEERVFRLYDTRGEALRTAIDRARRLDPSPLPEHWRTRWGEDLERAAATFALVDEVRRRQAERVAYEADYHPLHHEVRRLQAELRALEKRRGDLDRQRTRLARGAGSDAELRETESRIAALEAEYDGLAATLPGEWEALRAGYVARLEAETKARLAYRRNVDAAYGGVVALRAELAAAGALAALGPRIEGLGTAFAERGAEAAMRAFKEVEAELGEVAGAGEARQALSRARRALEGDRPDHEEASALLAETLRRHAAAVAWRRAADERLGGALREYDESLASSIGLRMQRRLSTEEAEEVAGCQAAHRDVSLRF